MIFEMHLLRIYVIVYKIVDDLNPNMGCIMYMILSVGLVEKIDAL